MSIPTRIFNPTPRFKRMPRDNANYNASPQFNNPSQYSFNSVYQEDNTGNVATGAVYNDYSPNASRTEAAPYNRSGRNPPASVVNIGNFNLCIEDVVGDVSVNLGTNLENLERAAPPAPPVHSRARSCGRSMVFVVGRVIYAIRTVFWAVCEAVMVVGEQFL
ncbi:hypothetical protein BDN72DRAFT_862194 [Pluteus cervinus]|uniref:Uncharacterized protein n=1 Tax=Pluteus cervinus TaxID=181527 RepID=A0ACD3AC61_9AGAR|nr:hypothetical protein BDN72DRAFT_862194 [Pluteus cervinus]